MFLVAAMLGLSLVLGHSLGLYLDRRRGQS